MYVAQQPYKCIKCQHDFKWGPHDAHPAPVTAKGIPVCPQCWGTFLEGLGLGYQTTVWNKNGSEYENKVKEKAND
jgi:hypothetical protein